MRRIIPLLLALALALSGCAGSQEGQQVENRDPEHNPQAITTKQDPYAEGGPIDPDAVMEHDAELAGPYGTLSLHLPVGWDYALLEPGDDDLRSGVYAIRFHPRRSAGFVEVGCNDSFGVCGTGLAEKTITLAGQEATMGVYDNHPYWDFIAWQGELKGIVALQFEESGYGWTTDEQQTALEILDSVAFDRERRSGCIGFYLPESEAEEIGLNLSLRDITPTGATLVWNVWDPEKASGQLQYGEGFTIEQWKEEAWSYVYPRTDDVGFNDVAHLIVSDEENTYALDWNWLYGALAPGTYRLCTAVADFRGTGDYQVYELNAAFVVN